VEELLLTGMSEQTGHGRGYMQGKHSYEGKHAKKRSGSKVQTKWIACAAALAAGGVLTGHIISSQNRAAELARFHISSNYLAEDGASYSVADWGSGFDVLLFNYENENVNQISEVDMSYTVTADNAVVSVWEQDGDVVAAGADGVYLFDTEITNAYHVLHVMPEDSAEGAGPVTVTVETTSPVQKTLSAQFQIQKQSKPDFTVTDQKDGTVLIRVNTNDYQDTMTVVWDPEKYSPDTSNELMSSWEGGDGVGHFPASRDTDYELQFYKKSDDPCTEQTGSATEISLD